MNLQQLPRPVEMYDPMTYEEWAEKEEVAYNERAFKAIEDELEYVDGYPTGELTVKHETMEATIADYLHYLKEWRAKNETNIMWKFYEIRDLFIPDEEDEVIMAFDYSNLEMRLLGHFSGDPLLTETFLNDEDAHGGTAVNMFSLDCTAGEAKKKYPHLRQIAKTINFLLMYGGGAFTLYNTLSDQDAVDENGDPVTKEKAQEYYDRYFEAYAGVAEFIKNQKKFAHRHEQVFTVIGRKRRLPDINSNDYKIVGYQERLSVNSCIQGSGGDIMMVCQPKIDNDPRLKELGCRMILQVHDK